jgi:hypothetical protein
MATKCVPNVLWFFSSITAVLKIKRRINIRSLTRQVFVPRDICLKSYQFGSFFDTRTILCTRVPALYAPKAVSHKLGVNNYLRICNLCSYPIDGLQWDRFSRLLPLAIRGFAGHTCLISVTTLVIIQFCPTKECHDRIVGRSYL